MPVLWEDKRDYETMIYKPEHWQTIRRRSLLHVVGGIAVGFGICWLPGWVVLIPVLLILGKEIYEAIEIYPGWTATGWRLKCLIDVLVWSVLITAISFIF